MGAPDVFAVGGWMPMREYPENEAVDFAIVGTGAGGGTLACRLAEAGFSVVAFDVGPWWRPLEDFASDETHQQKLYWTDERICDGANSLTLGANNSGQSVGGSTVHFAMVSLRFGPHRFKARSQLGYGADWPIGAASLALTEYWNYSDEGKDFAGGYCFMSQGPLPVAWAATMAGARKLGASRCAGKWRSTIIRWASRSSAK
jgi:choline dehydrogenase-like flavoprotein